MRKRKDDYVMMAFSEGGDTREWAPRPKYIGVATASVLAVCPSLDELKKIYPSTQREEAPVYLSERDSDGKKVKYARIEIILHADGKDNLGIDVTPSFSFFLSDEYDMNRDKTKCRVIDKFGRTAWVTNEEMKAHEIPTYKNGVKANLDKDYRPCLKGEDKITGFVKALLNIPDPMTYKDGKWTTVDDTDECLARFEDIHKFLNGNFKEFEDIVKEAKERKVQVLFGVRTGEDGKQYQTVFTNKFLPQGFKTASLTRELTNALEHGMYATSEFDVAPLKEYTVKETLLDAPGKVDNPFSSEEDLPF